jgi:DNA-directed RNA polymerase sigma subunit (sigma70/sigma32)
MTTYTRTGDPNITDTHAGLAIRSKSEVARLMGISRHRVAQLEEKALRKLREALRRQAL